MITFHVQCVENLLELWEGNVNRHIKINHANQTYGCSYCDFLMMSKQSLLNHIEIVHASENKLLACSICNSNFRGKFNSDKHLASKCLSSNRIKYLCDICEKPFVTIPTLKRHVISFHVSK